MIPGDVQGHQSIIYISLYFQTDTLHFTLYCSGLYQSKYL